MCAHTQKQGDGTHYKTVPPLFEGPGSGSHGRRVIEISPLTSPADQRIIDIFKQLHEQVTDLLSKREGKL